MQKLLKTPILGYETMPSTKKIAFGDKSANKEIDTWDFDNWEASRWMLYRELYRTFGHRFLMDLEFANDEDSTISEYEIGAAQIRLDTLKDEAARQVLVIDRRIDRPPFYRLLSEDNGHNNEEEDYWKALFDRERELAQYDYDDLKRAHDVAIEHRQYIKEKTAKVDAHIIITAKKLKATINPLKKGAPKGHSLKKVLLGLQVKDNQWAVFNANTNKYILLPEQLQVGMQDDIELYFYFDTLCLSNTNVGIIDVVDAKTELKLEIVPTAKMIYLRITESWGTNNCDLPIGKSYDIVYNIICQNTIEDFG